MCVFIKNNSLKCSQLGTPGAKLHFRRLGRETDKGGWQVRVCVTSEKVKKKGDFVRKEKINKWREWQVVMR